MPHSIPVIRVVVIGNNRRSLEAWAFVVAGGACREQESSAADAVDVVLAFRRDAVGADLGAGGHHQPGMGTRWFGRLRHGNIAGRARWNAPRLKWPISPVAIRELASAACREASRLSRSLRAGHRGPVTKGTPPRNAMPRRRALRAGAAPEPGHSPTTGIRLDLRQGSCGTAVQRRQSRRPTWAGRRSSGHPWFTRLSLRSESALVAGEPNDGGPS